MPLERILENDIFEDIVLLRDCIDNRRYWTSFNYKYCLDKIDELQLKIQNRYSAKSGYGLKEASRQIFDKTFAGDLQVFIEYFNGILYLSKLHHRVSYHQENGCFPKE